MFWLKGDKVRVLAGAWRGHLAEVESSERALAGNRLVRVKYVEPSPAGVTHGSFDEKHLERA